jgi:hypothetical protein
MKNSRIKRKMHSGQEIPTLFLSSNYSNGFLVVFIYFHFVWSHPLLLINAEKRNKLYKLYLCWIVIREYEPGTGH